MKTAKKAVNKKTARKAVNKKTTNKKTIAKKAVNKKTEKAVKNELDTNYVFQAKNSSVRDVRALNIYDVITKDDNEYLRFAKYDNDNSFFNLFYTDNYIKSVMNCKTFANYNSKKNNCLICNVSALCKVSKLDRNNQVTNDYNANKKAVRTTNSKSMIDNIVLSLYNNETDKKTLKEQLSAKYNKTLSSVNSQITSFNCVINKLKNDNLTADENSKLTDKYACYVKKTYNAKLTFTTAQKSTARYFNDALTILIKHKIIDKNDYRFLNY